MNSKYVFLITFLLSSLLTIYNSKISNSSVLDSYLSKHLIVSEQKESIVQRIAKHYLKRLPLNSFENQLTIKEAQKVQKKLVNYLSLNLGEIVGYKAALTNKNAQKNFGINQPLSGFFLEQMLLKNNAVIPHDFGVKMMLEGDLIVRVKSGKINDAKTPEETLKYLDTVIPFIELPKNVELNAPVKFFHKTTPQN